MSRWIGFRLGAMLIRGAWRTLHFRRGWAWFLVRGNSVLCRGGWRRRGLGSRFFMVCDCGRMWGAGQGGRGVW